MTPALPANGHKQAQHIDARRRHHILVFVSYITSLVMFFYGIRSLNQDSLLLPFILFATGSCFLLNILLYHISQQLHRACIIEALLVGTFVLSLVYQGGYNNTALYWVFPFPAILFGLLGVRNALVGNAMLLLMLGVMLFTPDLLQAEYKEAETSRFLASLVIVITVCWINDHYRERSHAAMEQLQQSKELQANTDALTGLANRRFLDSSLVPALEQQSDELLPLAVIMCDLDHFKQLNDQFGHDVGDEVLQAVATVFRHNIRQQDIACRFGGEEFLLVLPHTSTADARLVAEKIRLQLSKEQLNSLAPDYQLTASFGVAGCNLTTAFYDAIKIADQKLYQAKHQGRNQVCA